MIELPVLIENIIEIVNVAIEMMLVFLYFSLLSKAKVNKAVLYLSYLLSTVILSATVLLTDKALRKNLCKFKNCDKSDILERLKNNRSNFFTVYNGYCNLSRFFGYQPAGMERSGMESG